MGQTAPDTGSAGGPDLGALWRSYSQWTTEAGERYQSDIDRINRIPGLSDEGRATETQKRSQAYQEELSGLREGPTWQALSGYFDTMKARYSKATPEQFESARMLPKLRDIVSGFREAETPEDYYRAQYGDYVAPGSEQDAAGPASAMDSQIRQPGAEGTDAAVAGLGPRRPWWAL